MSRTTIQKTKLKVAIILTVLIVMIFGKNILERRNFNELGNSFVSFYEDRLVVESYIFSISEKLFRIKLLVNHCQFESDYSHVVDEISTFESDILNLVKEFEDTKLTIAEAGFLTDFKKIIQENLRIADYQSLYSEESGINADKVKEYNSYIEKAILDLEKLSLIQIEEGKKLATNSEKVVNRSKIWAQFEVAALVILIVIIYLLIYTSRSIKSDFVE
ncbi:MCP four helix bundle domain-containing protein [Aquiflexum gelatinilyticum]|uniref:MCP four helix bundle domain-containing protein n=1 Tax=Aquiflexum gelatinilyticum TaxID=2961943 RepID=A0A9X2PBK3_9BACT|nr:MCP four helix bundle domain-containing protein [Aquiflexum gelatinilyticum]MCR9016574.1 MCP four helix bundle domain-containing protein [Aquiflexum gelatinilyticum]MCS4436522.1 MCP four helix bundle domain-containing protein [Aquiflexum gelatinilyticum]